LAFRRAGDLDAARDAIAAAVELTDHIRGKVPGEDLRVSYTARIQDYYETAVDILAAIAAARGDEESRLAAWRMAERGRARALSDAVRDVKPVAAGPAAVAAWEKFRNLEARIAIEAGRLTRATPAAEPRKALSDLHAERDQALALLERLDTRRRAVLAAP